MILFGVLALASAPVAEAWSWPAIAVLWLVGAPLASVATGLWYRSRELELGAAADTRPLHSHGGIHPGHSAEDHPERTAIHQLRRVACQVRGLPPGLCVTFR
jgi:hypothetical protein